MQNGSSSSAQNSRAFEKAVDEHNTSKVHANQTVAFALGNRKLHFLSMIIEKKKIKISKEIVK